jgi:undecaprenyl-diphosphatase
VDWLQVVFLSLIQGFTEFLPISSSAHLILPTLLTDWPDQGLAFDVSVHFGTLVAVVLYFRHDLTQMASASSHWVVTRESSAETDMVLKLAIATIPVVVAGFTFQDFVEQELRTITVIASTTMIFGFVLWLADRRPTQNDDIGWNIALLIGLAQMLALVPGTSRSGITITAALLLGISRTSAARFSFLLAIPAIAGAQVLMTLDAVEQGLDAAWPHLIAGTSIAAISAYLCIHFFVALIERTGMLPYVLYRFALGIALLLFAYG